MQNFSACIGLLKIKQNKIDQKQESETRKKKHLQTLTNVAKGWCTNLWVSLNMKFDFYDVEMQNELSW